MPYFETDVTRYFEKEIRESANEKIKKLKEEIESVKKRMLDTIDEEIHASVFRAMEIELNEMNLDYSAQINRLKLQTHQKLIRKKRELMESILLEVQKKLKAFTKTSKYKANMKKMIMKIDKSFCGNNILFRIKKNDKTMKEILAENYTNIYEIEETDEIILGGFIAICRTKGILSDQTLDAKLEEKRNMFNQKMKFVIKE